MDKERDEEIEIYPLGEMQELLTAAEARFVPFIAPGTFAGIRHAEIQRLDRQEVRLANGVVEIHAGKAKTVSRRMVPILPCLRACWELHRRESGPGCACKSMAEAF